MSLINQLLAARDRQRLDLRGLNLTEAQIEKMMRPVESAIAHYNLVPVKVIEPARNLYETLDFTPQLIEQAMDMGRKYVADNWLDLKQFLRV